MNHSRILMHNGELTLKDKVHGPRCPVCMQRTGRPKTLLSPTFKCTRCNITICFRRNKFIKDKRW